MFKRPKKSKRNTQLDTLIGPHTQLEGNIAFTGGLRVEGRIKGDVTAQDEVSLLTVSKEGAVEGQVKVPYIILNGSVNGDVHANEHIELAPQAQITGDVYYHMIEIAIGAKINGNLVYRENTEEQPTPTLKLATAPEAETKSLNRGLKESNT